MKISPKKNTPVPSKTCHLYNPLVLPLCKELTAKHNQKPSFSVSRKCSTTELTALSRAGAARGINQPTAPSYGREDKGHHWVWQDLLARSVYWLRHPEHATNSFDGDGATFLKPRDINVVG